MYRDDLAKPVFAILVVTFLICYILGFYSTSTSYEYSDEGYVVTKCTENSLHYVFTEDTAAPEFTDRYYLTVFLDGNYVKFQTSYKYFEKYNLGDRLTMVRKCNSLLHIFSDYSACLGDIEVPAVIVDKSL